MPALGAPELIIILLLVVIVFGVGKLPEIGGALGKGIKEFRSATTDEAKDKKTDQSPQSKDSAA
ncbi:MAG: twin-arginine translocase TatA/TatE family subunit [Chloroflexota bacterium]